MLPLRSSKNYTRPTVSIAASRERTGKQRAFSKFQVMSVVRTGFQVMKFDAVNEEVGGPQRDFNQG